MKRMVRIAIIGAALAPTVGCGVQKEVVRDSALATTHSLDVASVRLDPCIKSADPDSADCQDVKTKLRNVDDLNHRLEQRAQ